MHTVHQHVWDESIQINTKQKKTTEQQAASAAFPFKRASQKHFKMTGCTVELVG